jgi:hypothetical protein
MVELCIGLGPPSIRQDRDGRAQAVTNVCQPQRTLRP